VSILVTYNVRVTERAAITGMLANLLPVFVLQGLMEFGQPIHPPAQAKVFSARMRHSGAWDARGFFEHLGYRLTGIGYCSMIASSQVSHNGICGGRGSAPPRRLRRPASFCP
jgi:hypothetical protein